MKHDMSQAREARCLCTAAAATRSITVAGTGSAEVETDGTAIQLSAVEVVEGLASLIN